MKFEEKYADWKKKRLLKEEAAELLEVCPRTFRRYINRYEESGLEGLQVAGAVERSARVQSSHQSPMPNTFCIACSPRRRSRSAPVR